MSSTAERCVVLHKLIREQHLETLIDEINRDKNTYKGTEPFNIDEMYALHDSGKSLLMTAVEEGNMQMVRMLHKQFGASLNYVDKLKQSCLFTCVQLKNYHQSETILEFLLSNQAKVNILDSNGRSPFYIALKNNNLPAAYLLYSEGNAEIDQVVDSDGNTVIHEAVKSGNIATVTFLVTQCSADLLKPNLKEEIPFFLALQYPRMVNQILRNLNPTTQEPNRSAINNNGRSKRSSLDSSEYLNSIVKFKSSKEKRNILHICSLYGYINSLGELLTHISEHSINEMTSEKDYQGNIPLHLSVICNYPEITFVLNQLKPSDAYIQNNDGDTAMHVALKNSAYKCARVLYNNSKAFVKENNAGETIQFLLQQFKHELKQEEDISKSLLQVDLSNHENYKFHKLITDHTFISKMKDFLSLNNNQDMMLFYEIIQEFKMINSHSERYQMAEQIHEHFLDENAQQKLKFMKAVVLKNALGPFYVKFKECSSSHCPKDLFLNLETLAVRSLKTDSFPKFIQSKLFTKYLERKKQTDPSFLIRFVKNELNNSDGADSSDHNNGSSRMNSATHSTNTGSSMEKDKSESEEIEGDEDYDVVDNVKVCPKCGTELLDLKNHTFTDKDFKKAIENLKDISQWRIINETEGGRTLTSPPALHNHLSNSRRHTQVKYIGEMNCSNHSLFNMWVDPDYAKCREEKIDSVKQIDFVKSGKYACVIQHEVLKMKFPQKNREFIHAYCCKYEEEENRYICISRSVSHPKAPETSKHVRGEVKTEFLVERISDNKCRYYYSVCADFGGWLSPDFYHNVVKSQSEYIHANLVKLVKQREQLGKKRPDKGGYIQSLDYYLSKK